MGNLSNYFFPCLTGTDLAGLHGDGELKHPISGFWIRSSVPHEFPDLAIVSRLSKYCDVVSQCRDHFHNQDGKQCKMVSTTTVSV